VHAPPADLDVALLAAALRDGWSVDAPLTYVPVGNGSHHWRAGDAFVTVDDLGTKPWLGTAHDETFAALRVAYDAAATLRATLPFVVAPQPSRDGASTVRLTDRYAVSVLPWLDDLTPAGDLDDAERAVEALHDAGPPPLRTARPEVPRRESLEEALRDLATPWDGGPFSERARALLAHGADDVRRLLDAFDAITAEPAGPLVVTHGEPHTGNLLRTKDGLALVDWDTVALGERERDLWLLPAGGDPRRRMLYAIRWTLDDAASFVTTLRDPHGEVDAPVLRYLDLTLATASDQVRDL